MDDLKTTDKSSIVAAINTFIKDNVTIKANVLSVGSHYKIYTRLSDYFTMPAAEVGTKVAIAINGISCSQVKPRIYTKSGNINIITDIVNGTNYFTYKNALIEDTDCYLGNGGGDGSTSTSSGTMTIVVYFE